MSLRRLTMPAAASSIGIIGGADGPTAVFVTANNKEEAIPRAYMGYRYIEVSLCRVFIRKIPCILSWTESIEKYMKAKNLS